MLSIGIVGLPNVGKSTLFNALTRSKLANAQNFPFCTIDPNIGVVEVPDDRLYQLARVSQSQKTIPTAIQFVDIAGLVKGASEGAGLGNKFLSHIREVDAIAHVVRSFTDQHIIHVHTTVDPTGDADVINMELAIADLDTVQKRLQTVKKNAKGLQGAAAKDAEKMAELCERVYAHLETGMPARALSYTEDESALLKELHLLTMKPMIYVINTDEAQGSKSGVQNSDAPMVDMCVRLEAELADLSLEEAAEYMKESGMKESGLDMLIKAGYDILGLITYFTSGAPETRAWTVRQGAKAPEAAGVIHTDFIKGFVKADAVNWQDFVALGGWSKLRESGKLRLEGKEYVVREGDVCYFHIAA